MNIMNIMNIINIMKEKTIKRDYYLPVGFKILPINHSSTDTDNIHCFQTNFYKHIRT